MSIQLVEQQQPGEGTPAEPVVPLWRVPDVCRFLGMKKSWVYQQVALNEPGGLPFRRLPGGRLRFDPDEVRDWFRRQAPGGGRKQ